MSVYVAPMLLVVALLIAQAPVEPAPVPQDATPTPGAVTTPTTGAVEGPTPPTTTPAEDAAALRAQLTEMKGRVEALEDDLDEVLGELDRQALAGERDRLHWSGDYRVILNNFHQYDREEEGLPWQVPSSTTYPNLWTHRLRLALQYDVLDRVRFYGRIVFFKNFGETIEKPLFFDTVQTRFARDSALRLERAYIDWFITDWLVLTAGRIAAPEGPPAELKENTTRSATWGVQVVEAEMDGVMMTAYLPKIPFLKQSYLRPFYLPFHAVTDVDPFDEDSQFKDVGIAPMQAFGLLGETGIAALGDNLIQVSGVWVPEFKPRVLPILDVFPEAPYATSLGWFAQLSFLMEQKDLFDSGLDLFVAWNFSVLGPNGQTVLYDFGDGFELPAGLASFDDTEHTAHMIYGGTRYTLPLSGEAAPWAPRFGFEVNRGTKYNTLFSSPADTKINKLGVRGNVFDFYWIQPLVPDHLFSRVGLMHVQRDFEGSFVGPALPTTTSTTALQVLLHASW